MSYLLVTSYGECIDNTGTPQSITSIPLFARIYAIVPPPPTSTLPSSATWYAIFFDSKRFLISATYSAFASYAPPFPLAPVYLFNPIPYPKYEALFFSDTLAYIGSNPASTSADNILELQNTFSNRFGLF